MNPSVQKLAEKYSIYSIFCAVHTTIYNNVPLYNNVQKNLNWKPLCLAVSLLWSCHLAGLTGC